MLLDRPVVQRPPVLEVVPKLGVDLAAEDLGKGLLVLPVSPVQSRSTRSFGRRSQCRLVSGNWSLRTPCANGPPHTTKINLPHADGRLQASSTALQT